MLRSRLFEEAVNRLKGGSMVKRTGGLGKVSALISKTAKEQIISQKDPLKIIRPKLKSDRSRLKDRAKRYRQSKIRNLKSKI
jgi:hypothetical protein